ncbi:hypothetical protein VC83_08340 [Pseudogymnoascus destructans]|uniref:Uncharacterized protein n=1 Tax=Pseudogymnoascus destructans TaxID=655981 RepID=A0A176ZZW5_9PEZI|nr:uncharacterized protein VC83_08340 [Pseudogymnoascus destructans]OAF55438.1 hypothetical protein VC83_08340 [Pseudogymnoascus destructans]
MLSWNMKSSKYPLSPYVGEGMEAFIGWVMTLQSSLTLCLSELIVHLFVRRSDASEGHQVVLIGSIKLNPFLEPHTLGAKSVDVQHGTGKVLLEVSYVEKEILPFEDWKKLILAILSMSKRKTRIDATP